MLDDAALEANRRLAWARFYRARADLEQIARWAAELAVWLDELVDELPPAAAELVAIVSEAVDESDARLIANYVHHQRRLAAA